jgi:hypothetical protein
MGESVAERPSIDFLILADKAEAVNGKLYMLGGAWDRVTPPSLDQPVAFSIAVGVLVPWGRTNEDLALRVSIEDEDGTPLGPKFEAKVNVGRPSRAIPGQLFRALFTVSGLWQLPGAGTYRVVAELGDEETKRVVFHVFAKTQVPPAT